MTEQLSSNRRWWAAILLTTAVGAVIRFADIGGQSFWYDEAYSARIAERSTTWELLSGAHRDNGNPPLYYIAHRWTTHRFGTGEAGQRLFAALCGVLTIPVIGRLASRLFDRRAGLIAALLFAVSPLSVELSNEARVYSFLHLITALDALLLIQWLDSQKWRDGLMYLVVTTLACYAHYFVVFFVFSHLVAVLAVADRMPVFRRWCLAMLGVAALWAWWAPAFLDQLRTPGNLSRMAEAWIMQFASTPVVFSLGRTFAWRDAAPALLGLAALISLAAFCIPALLGGIRLLQRNRSHGVLLAGWVLFPVAIPFVAAMLKSPVYHHRYGSVALSGFLCLTAIGIRELPVSLRSATLSVTGIATAFSLTNYYTQPIKDDWRSAARSVLAGTSTEQIVLTDSDIEVLPLMYYAAQSGRLPRDIYGLMASPGFESRFTGVRYEKGRKMEDHPIDHTDRIVAAPSICLALCLPEKPLEIYRRLFAEHGYELTSEEDFYRITVVRFERRREIPARENSLSQSR